MVGNFPDGLPVSGDFYVQVCVDVGIRQLLFLEILPPFSPGFLSPGLPAVLLMILKLCNNLSFKRISYFYTLQENYV